MYTFIQHCSGFTEPTLNDSLPIQCSRPIEGIAWQDTLPSAVDVGARRVVVEAALSSDVDPCDLQQDEASIPESSDCNFPTLRCKRCLSLCLDR